MKRGVLTVSPKALRISLRQTFRTASLTAIPGQTAASSPSLVTNCPAWATRYCSTVKAFGVRVSISAPCHTHALPGSRRKDAKTDCSADDIVTTPHERRSLPYTCCAPAMFPLPTLSPVMGIVNSMQEYHTTIY